MCVCVCVCVCVGEGVRAGGGGGGRGCVRVRAATGIPRLVSTDSWSDFPLHLLLSISTLAAPSVGKRPISNATFETVTAFFFLSFFFFFFFFLFFFFAPFASDTSKTFLSRCTVLKVDLLHDHQIYRLEVCMRALFVVVVLNPGNFTGWGGSEGVKPTVPPVTAEPWQNAW